MNRIYRSVWNQVTRSFSAAAEKVRGRGKPVSSCRNATLDEAAADGTDFALTPLVEQPRQRKLAVGSGFRPLALEQRFMFDGAAAVDTVHAADAAIANVPAPVEVRAADPAKDNGKKEVVFVDTAVANYKALEAGIKDGVAIVEIDGSKDGLAQIAKWAETHSGFDAIHILSHGSEAMLHLGTNTVSETTLSSVVTQAELAAIGKALTTDGDLLLYGCDVAKGADGQQFIAKLAAATGADVAASTDATGAVAKGGDWILEVSSGNQDQKTVAGLQPAGGIEALIALNETVQGSYDTLLALPSTTQNFVTPNYWTGNTGGNTVDGFSLTESTGAARGTAYDPDFYFQTCVATDSNGKYYYELTWTADNTDLGTFDLDSFSIKNYAAGLGGCDFKLDFTASNGQTQSYTSSSVAANSSGDTIDIDQTRFNDISSFKLRVTLIDATSQGDPANTSNLALVSMVLADLKAPVPTKTVSTASLSADTGTSSSDFITKTAAQTISGTLSANLSAGERVEVSYDGGSSWSDATTYTVGSNNWSATTTLSGSNTFEARVANAIGGGTAYTHTYALDTTNPVAPGTPDLATASDSGSSSTDNITNVASPVINGAAEANATVTLYDTDGATVLGTTTANGAGNWSITSSALSAGAHTLTAKATDVAGNTGIASSGLAITIDTANPAAPSAPDLVTASDSGASSTDNLTKVTTPMFTGTAEANATVKLYDTNGTTVLGTTTADGAGNWSISSALSDGAHTLTAKATDAAGNTGSASSNLAITIDAVAPTVTSVSVPSNGSYKAGTNLDFTVNFDEAVTVSGTPRIALVIGATTVQADYFSGSGTSALVFRYTVLAGQNDSDGIAVGALTLNGGTLRDAAGNDAVQTLNSVGSTAIVLVDTIAPGAPSTPTLATASDSGVSPSDGITKVTTPVFTGTAEANATVKLYDTDGTTLLGTTTANGAGNWSITSSALSAGAHTLTTKATDAAGNTGIASNGLTITIDTSAPTASVSAATIATGANVTSNQSTETGFVYLVKSTVTPTDYASLEAAVTGNNATKATVSAANSNTSISTVGLAVGTYYTYSVDAAGNVSAASTNAITLAQGPSITVSTVAISADTGTSSSDFITQTAAQTISGTLSGNTIAGESVEVSLDNGNTWITASNTIGQNTWSLAGQTLTGSNTLQVRVANAVGGGAALSQAYVLDTTAPTTTVATKAFSADTGASASDFITKTAAQTISGTLSSNLASGETVEVSLDNGSTWATATTTVGQNTWSLAGQTLTGNNTLLVRVSDTAGNHGTVSPPQSYALDQTAPTVSDARINISGATGTAGAFKIGDTVTATWNNTAGGDNNSDIATATVDFSAFGGGTAVAASNNSGTWSATYTIVAGAIDGINKNVSVTATDNAGNIATQSDSSNATLDNVTPTVTDGNINIISSGSGPGGKYVVGDTITVRWRDTGGDANNDTIAGVTVNFSAFGGGTAVVATNVGGVWTTSYTVTAASIEGTNLNATVTATDNAGNSKTTADSSNLTLDLPPTVTDARISINSGSGSNGAFKTGDTVTAIWNNTASGDNNSDIANVTVDFSAFGGGTAVVASNRNGTWTATYTIVAGVADGINKNVSVRVTDNAGNITTCTDSTNAKIENNPVPSVEPPPPIIPTPIQPPQTAPLQAPTPIDIPPPAPAPTVFLPPASILGAPTGDAIQTQPGVAPPPQILQRSFAPEPLTGRTGASGGFPVTLLGGTSSGQDRLVVFQGMRDQAISSSGQVSEFKLPADAFASSRAGAVVQLQARQGDGRPLPSWLKFDAQTGTFRVQAPAGFSQDVAIKVVARDAAGHEAVMTFKIHLGERGQRLPGRLGLSEQIRQASRPHAALDRLATPLRRSA